jgi:hypothetical protein
MMRRFNGAALYDGPQHPNSGAERVYLLLFLRELMQENDGCDLAFRRLEHTRGDA